MESEEIRSLNSSSNSDIKMLYKVDSGLGDRKAQVGVVFDGGD